MIKISAPAKLNLFLKVLNKRKDSYHNIFTLFERISLADEITITKIPKGIEISSDKFITRNPKDNIAFRAAELILKYKKIKSGVRIHIKKNIPIAAGMGGGSSDAASVLVGINKLFGFKLSKITLMKLGGRLGADVPFFIMDTPFAVGRRKGELLKKIDIKTRLWHLVVYPGFRLSTKEIYDAYDRSLKNRDTSHLKKRDVSRLNHRCLTLKNDNVKIATRLRSSMDFNDIGSMLHNDLEEIVTVKFKGISNIIERLAYSLGRKVILTGSGPSVFCIYPTGKEAIDAKKKSLGSIPARDRKGWSIFTTKTT